jgi:predicted nucleotidyltransferase
MNTFISKYRTKLATLSRELDITYLALFGSYARGEQKKNSDVDMLVEFNPKIRKSLFDLMLAEQEIARVVGRKVDLVSKSGISKHIKPYIMNDLQVLYAENS